MKVEVPIWIESTPNLREQLMERLHYDPETGQFTRLVKTSGSNGQIGAVVGGLSHGYVRFHFKGRLEGAHRMAWLYMTGELPAERIDHRDGNPSNNHWGNLRLASHSMNLENQRRARADNRLGVLGVRKRLSNYEARIWVKGKPKHLGSFPTQELASNAYIAAKRELHEGCTL